jgi:poly(A) polymerase
MEHRSLEDAMLEKLGDFALTLTGWASLDLYFQNKPAPLIPLRYPGTMEELSPLLDKYEHESTWLGSLVVQSGEEGGSRWVIRLEEKGSSVSAWAPGHFPYRIQERSYADPQGNYSLIRKKLVGLPSAPLRALQDWGDVAEAAVFTSRYNWRPDPYPGSKQWPLLSLRGQRQLLELVLESEAPWRGLEYLESTGFLAQHWPLLDSLRRVEHTKDHHPEGNGWNHTLETFRFRKKMDFVTDVAMLLHDVGKATAKSEEGNRFHKHADLGAKASSRFLRAMGFGGDFVEDVYFLVKNHMVPGLVENVPLHRFDRVLQDPRLPKLLELFRGDSGATWRGPEEFFRVTKKIKQYLEKGQNEAITTMDFSR